MGPPLLYASMLQTWEYTTAKYMSTWQEKLTQGTTPLWLTKQPKGNFVTNMMDKARQTQVTGKETAPCQLCYRCSCTRQRSVDLLYQINKALSTSHTQKPEPFSIEHMSTSTPSSCCMVNSLCYVMSTHTHALLWQQQQTFATGLGHSTTLQCTCKNDTILQLVINNLKWQAFSLNSISSPLTMILFKSPQPNTSHWLPRTLAYLHFHPRNLATHAQPLEPCNLNLTAVTHAIAAAICWIAWSGTKYG